MIFLIIYDKSHLHHRHSVLIAHENLYLILAIPIEMADVFDKISKFLTQQFI